VVPIQAGQPGSSSKAAKVQRTRHREFKNFVGALFEDQAGAPTRSHGVVGGVTTVFFLAHFCHTITRGFLDKNRHQMKTGEHAVTSALFKRLSHSRSLHA